MTDLETAADVALVKTKELSAHIDKAEAAFTALEERLDAVKAQFREDWTALDESVKDLLDLARTQTTGIAEDGEESRQALAQLDESLADDAAEWAGALENGVVEASALRVHVSEQEPLVSAARDQAVGAAQGLAERAAAIEAQLQQMVSDVRELLETEVAHELREVQEVLRERAAALLASLAEECETAIAEAFAAWERQLAQVEEVIEQEFASARQHAAAVVDFSLQVCRQGHEDAWGEIEGLLADTERLLLGLGEVVGARAAELGERRGAAEQALSEAAVAVERMRAAFAQELETMARYEFVRV